MPESPVKYEVNGNLGYKSFSRSPPQDGASSGSDFAGVVVKIGDQEMTDENVDIVEVKVGDAVAGFISSHADPTNGCFQGMGSCYFTLIC